jgi:hypothetical protein
MPSTHRERGLWSFLTWSFFISQVLAAGSFIVSSARAAGDMDNTPPSTDHSSAQAAVASPQAVAAIHADAPGDTATSAHVSSSLVGAQHALDDLNASRTIVGLAEPSGNHGADSVTIAQVLDVGVDHSLNTVLGAVGNVVGPLEAVVDHAVAPLVDTVGELVGSLTPAIAPMAIAVGQAVAPITGVVGSGTIEDLTPATLSSISGVLPEAGTPVVTLVARAMDSAADATGAHDIVASAGNFVLPDLTSVGALGVNDLFSGGSHTPYRLALNEGLPVAQPQGVSTSIIDAILGEQHSESGLPDDHHGTPAATSTVPSALEELHLRGLGDALG